jgi:DNA-binding NtrC family response regulator
MSVARKIKIMVVDDDKNILAIFRDVFNDSRFEVFATLNGPAAVAEFRHQKYDLAFIDILMPDMNGLEVLAALLKINPDLVAIMISGFRDEKRLEEALKIGAKYYLYKPFDVHDIFSIALKCLQQLGIQDEIEPIF